MSLVYDEKTGGFGESPEKGPGKSYPDLLSQRKALSSKILAAGSTQLPEASENWPALLELDNQLAASIPQYLKENKGKFQHHQLAEVLQEASRLSQDPSVSAETRKTLAQYIPFLPAESKEASRRNVDNIVNSPKSQYTQDGTTIYGAVDKEVTQDADRANRNRKIAGSLPKGSLMWTSHGFSIKDQDGVPGYAGSLDFRDASLTNLAKSIVKKTLFEEQADPKSPQRDVISFALCLGDSVPDSVAQEMQEVSTQSNKVLIFPNSKVKNTSTNAGQTHGYVAFYPNGSGPETVDYGRLSDYSSMIRDVTNKYETEGYSGWKPQQ